MYNDNRNSNGANGRRPRFSVNNPQHEGGYGPRREGRPAPRFSRNGDGEYNNAERSAARPRFNASEDYQRRPRFNQDGDYQSRPRYNQGEGYSSRPRFNRSNDNTDYRRNEGQGNGEQGQRAFRPRPQRNAGVYSERKRQVYQKQYEDPTKPIRLNKYLANAGICSRREADDFILAGVISVNGEVVDSLGAKVLPTDKVQFHNQPVRRERKVYILLNKPKNTVTTTDDPQERNTVIDIVHNACSERIYPVGRLDRNTTGVLLLTNDGDLAAKLTHPKFGKKKIYAVTLDRELEEADEEALRAGVMLDDEKIVPDALEFPKEDRQHIGLEIHSGQNRVVRRIFEKVGYKVMQLDRVSFAGLTKKNVPRGKYRFLTPKEVAMLQMGAFE